jgi:hypothetical protein
MSVFPLESRRVINLNIMLLFCVSIEPFLFNLIRNTPTGLTDPRAFADAVSTLYALRQYWFEGVSWFVCGLLFALTALPIFFVIKLMNGDPIRYYLWIVPLLVIWITRNWYKYKGGSQD